MPSTGRPQSTQSKYMVCITLLPLHPTHRSMFTSFTGEGGKADESGTPGPGQFCPQLLRKPSNFCETKFPPLSAEMLSIMS